MQDACAPYCPVEEYPVTFQVGMVGIDGVLLASDKLVTEAPINEQSVRQTYLSDKITVLDEENLAYCWAGDDLCDSLCNRVRSELKKSPERDFKDQLIECGQLELQTKRRAPDGRELKGGVIFFVRRFPSGVELWKLSTNTSPLANLIRDKTYAGDPTNAARFFVEYYFPSERLRPIRQLIHLAAHSVLMAAKLNTGVRGLEMALCAHTKFEKLTDTRESLQLSGDLDRHIADILCPLTA